MSYLYNELIVKVICDDHKERLVDQLVSLFDSLELPHDKIEVHESTYIEVKYSHDEGPFYKLFDKKSNDDFINDVMVLTKDYETFIFCLEGLTGYNDEYLSYYSPKETSEYKRVSDPDDYSVHIDYLNHAYKKNYETFYETEIESDFVSVINDKGKELTVKRNLVPLKNEGCAVCSIKGNIEEVTIKGSIKRKKKIEGEVIVSYLEDQDDNTILYPSLSKKAYDFIFSNSFDGLVPCFNEPFGYIFHHKHLNKYKHLFNEEYRVYDYDLDQGLYLKDFNKVEIDIKDYVLLWHAYDTEANNNLFIMNKALLLYFNDHDRENYIDLLRPENNEVTFHFADFLYWLSIQMNEPILENNLTFTEYRINK